MASFAVLNDEKKILRRKEKEAERKVKLDEKIKAQSAEKVGNWADEASDREDEEMQKLQRPVSDSESESEHEAENERREDPKDDSAAKAPDGIGKAKEPPKVEAKPKKEAKKEQPPKKKEEDLDDVLAEFGIELNNEPDQSSAAAARRRKKKEKEAAQGEGTEKDKTGEKEVAAPAPEQKEPEDEVAFDEEKKKSGIRRYEEESSCQGLEDLFE
mmetsp:Transcript_70016/g.227104  ORF Transcript_70016/g.227104 Transcript_70016/m.227104 type:complete len:214 (+) Transcript_70016:122-763(+)